jgi:hypothetical protein
MWGDMTRRFSGLAFALSLLVAIAVFADPASQAGQGVIHHSKSDSVEAGRIPRYEVDASWPKPLPNNWLIGQVGGLAVDKHDHIWISQRPRSLTDDEKGAVPNLPTRAEPRSLCCKPAPSIMEFDSDGNLLQAWGGPEDPGKCVAPACFWPTNEHGIFVDDEDHVWLSGAGPTDRMVLEFSRGGKFLMMIRGSGSQNADSASRSTVGRAAGIFVDSSNKQVLVADGYLNSRVVKFDSRSGAFLKAWVASGSSPIDPPIPPPSDPNDVYAPQPPDPNSRMFNRPVHCVVLAHDGLVYVCDRSNNRIQVFSREGEFRHQFVFDPATRGNGSVWAVALSADKDQRFLACADGENNFVRIVDRKSGKVLATIGRSGRNAGQFHWVHQIAIDSKANLYTGEVDTSKRIQKFIPSRELTVE